MRDLELALAIGRKCGFKRGHVRRACAELSAELSDQSNRSGLTADYIEKCARRYRTIALDIIAEEQAQAVYEKGEMDILGRPICPQKPFAGTGVGE